MAAKKGNHKNTSAHGRRRMSHATRIRKRIFGITSLILAIVVANIPMGSQAALQGLIYNGFNLTNLFAAGTNGSFSISNTDAQQSSSPGDSVARFTYVDTGADPESGTKTLATLLHNKDLNAGDNYTNKIYALTYYQGDKNLSSNPQHSASSWGDASLYLGLTLRSMSTDGTTVVNNVMGFRDLYWSSTLEPKYASLKQTYVHRTYGASDTRNGWIAVGATYDGNADGYLGYAEGIPAGFWKDGTDSYVIDRIAFAYRKQMEVLCNKASDGSEIENPDYLMAACFLAENAGIRKIKFSNVADDSVLQGNLKFGGILDTDNGDKYYQLNMALYNDSNTDITLSGDDVNTFAVSIPLPSEMNQTGKSNDTNPKYEVYRLKENTTGDVSTATIEKIPIFEVIERDGKRMLQFEVQFTSGMKTYRNDFGVVFHDDGSGGSTDPSVNRTITVNTLPGAVNGAVTLTRLDTNVSNTTGTGGTYTLTVPSTVQVRLKPNPASGETFVQWESSPGTPLTSGSTDDPYVVPAGTNPVTLYARFSDNTGGGGGGTPTRYVLTVKTNRSGMSVTPASGSHEAGDVTVTANDNDGYYFGKWTWDAGNDGVEDASVTDKVMTQYLHSNSTATAYYYTLKYQEGRSALASDEINPDRAKLIKGTITADTTIRATANPTVVAKAKLNELALAQVSHILDKVKAVDYFHLAMNPASGVTGDYEIELQKFPLPYGMDASTETGGKIQLYFCEAVTDPSNPYLESVPVTQHNDGTITFKVNNSLYDMMGDYVLVQTTDPTFNVDDVRDNPTPSTFAGYADADYTGTLKGNRRLVIGDYNPGETIYEYTKNNFDDNLDGTGNKVGTYDDWAVINSQLYGKDTEDTSEVPKADLNRITIRVPIDVKVNSDDVKMYQITGGGGSYTYTPMVKGSDFTATTMGRRVTQIEIPDAQSSRYNGNFLLLFSKTPEFDIYDYRTDKPADSTYNWHLPKPSEDRYVTIESITPENTAKITQQVHAQAGFEGYEVIPYNIRYLDNPDPAIGVDKDDYSQVSIRLTIPTKARNKYGLRLVSLNEDVNPAQFIFPENATFASDQSYADFVATHFSEYALIYTETPPDTRVTVTPGPSTPTDGGWFTGHGKYEPGTLVTLTAQPATGYVIDYWVTDEGLRIDPSGTDANGNTTGTFTVTKDTVVNAVFKAPTPTYKVVGYVDPSGGGTVTPAAPDGQTYTAGQTAVLQATPSAGQEVDYWEDNGAQAKVGGTIYQIPNISADHTVIVHFKAAGSAGSATTATTTGDTPIVNVTTGTTGTPGGGGTVSQSTQGSSVTLTATPDSGYHFKEWQDANGNVVSTSNPYTFTPVGNINLRAVFEPDIIAAAGTGSGAGTGTTGSVTVSQTTTGGKGSNSIDMPRTGMDQAMVYKMLAVVILVMFGVIELLGSVNTKKRRVVTDG